MCNASYGSCAWGTFVCAGILSAPGLSTHKQLPPFRLTADLRQPFKALRGFMLKIVPDPPHNVLSLEDTLIQATDYALCAATVVHQAMLLQPTNGPAWTFATQALKLTRSHLAQGSSRASP